MRSLILRQNIQIIIWFSQSRTHTFNIKNGISIFDLVLSSKLANSKSEVRRMIKNNGLKINNEFVKNESKVINVDQFDSNNSLKVSHGKKQHVIIKII